MTAVIFTKKLLSASTSGRPIAVAATGSPGTLIHTAALGSDDLDEIWLWCTNTNATTDRGLSLQWGGTSASDAIEFGIPSGSGVLVVPGWVMNGGLLIRAFSSVANDLNITGWVNSIEPNF